MENIKQEEMDLGMDLATAGYEEIGVEAVETENFFKRNKTTMVATGTGLTGLIGGTVLGTWIERSKRNKVMAELEKKIKLAQAAEAGQEVIKIKDEEYETIGYTFNNPNEWAAYIMNELLSETKMDKKEKEKWRKLLISLNSLTASITEKAEKNSKTIINE